MRVATWNVQWAERRPGRGQRVADLLERLEVDILVVTEGCRRLLPGHGHVIDGGDDWGYGTEPTRRKVLAWSAEPWLDEMRLETGAGRGRVVQGRTSSPLGEVTVTAVCIPWEGAHVSTGRRDARRWGEHLDCCSQLAELTHGPRSIIAGDFNQRLPLSRQPKPVNEALEEVLAGWEVCTRGEIDGHRLIDHIATTPDLVGTDVASWPGRDDEGHLSDHRGVMCTLGASTL